MMRVTRLAAALLAASGLILGGCGGGDDDGGPVRVAVTPTSLLPLAPGAQQAFQAQVTGAGNTTVAWSIEEGAAGGTIDNTGLYRASGAAGSYHVRATSVADASVSTSVPVFVRPSLQSAVSATTGAIAGTVAPTAAQPEVYVQVAGNRYYGVVAGDGTFQFGSLLGGAQYTVGATKVGYAEVSQVVSVVANQVTGGVQLTLTPEAAPITGGVAGTVLSSGGEPVAGAIVGINGTGRFAFTRGDGTFSLSGLQPNTYTVSARSDASETGSAAVTVQAGQAAPVQIRLGG